MSGLAVFDSSAATKAADGALKLASSSAYPLASAYFFYSESLTKGGCSPAWMAAAPALVGPMFMGRP